MLIAGVSAMYQECLNTLRVTKWVRDQSVPLEGLVAWF